MLQIWLLFTNIYDHDIEKQQVFLMYFCTAKNMEQFISQLNLSFPNNNIYRNSNQIQLIIPPLVRPSLNLVYITSLLLDFIHIWYLGWPWSEHVHIVPISWIVDFCESYSPFHVCFTIRPSAHLVYATSHLYFVAFYSYLVSWLAMICACAYYTDFTNGWFCESYSPFHVCLSICQFAHLVYATSLLSHFIHIWYLDCPWSEHAHIIPISRMVDFCKSYSRFHVCLSICPSAHLVYATSLLSHFIHIWYLDWPWSEHAQIIPISRMVDFCES